MIVDFKYALGHRDAKAPTKRDEDGCYDLYAAFDEPSMIIPPHTVKLVPTGFYTAFSEQWQAKIEERGTNTKTRLQVVAGIMDSGWRGEWWVALFNPNNKPVIISKMAADVYEDACAIYHPYSKGIAQWHFEEVHNGNGTQISVEDLKSIPSERGEGCLGSSGK